MPDQRRDRVLPAGSNPAQSCPSTTPNCPSTTPNYPNRVPLLPLTPNVLPTLSLISSCLKEWGFEVPLPVEEV